MIDFEQIIVIGDVHNDMITLHDKIKRSNLTNTAFVQLGDFGIGFETFKEHKSKLNIINKTLSKNDCYLFILRGNHDNPSFWETIGNSQYLNSDSELIYSKNKCYKTHGKCGKYLLFSNIIFVPDYTIIDLTVNSIIKKCLFIGGGTSIDRCERKEGISWWRGETIRIRDLWYLKNFEFDYIFSHVPPKEALIDLPFKSNNILDYFIKKDTELRSDLDKEDRFISEVCSELKFKTIFSGHHHISHRAYIGKGKQAFIISIMEFILVS